MLAGFGPRYGLDADTALKLARAFGSGMAVGETCGAVVGSLMVLGLSRGEILDADDGQRRSETYKLGREFMRRFEARRGTVGCSALLDLDMSTEEGQTRAKERGLFTTVCPGIVKDAAEILDEMLVGD